MYGAKVHLWFAVAIKHDHRYVLNFYGSIFPADFLMFVTVSVPIYFMLFFVVLNNA